MEQCKPDKLERIIDSAVLIGSVVGAGLLTNSNGTMVGLSVTAYSTYWELKKFVTPKYGKPSLKNYVGWVASGWLTGCGIDYLDSKF